MVSRVLDLKDLGASQGGFMGPPSLVPLGAKQVEAGGPSGRGCAHKLPWACREVSCTSVTSLVGTRWKTGRLLGSRAQGRIMPALTLEIYIAEPEAVLRSIAWRADRIVGQFLHWPCGPQDGAVWHRTHPLAAPYLGSLPLGASFPQHPPLPHWIPSRRGPNTLLICTGCARCI